MDFQNYQLLKKAALSLGYSETDLQPISIDQLQQQCRALTKKMQPKQKQFYLQRKMMISQARRQKILKEVRIHARFLKDKQQKTIKFNPKLKQIFDQHEKLMKKNSRYKQVISRGLQSSQSRTREKQLFNSGDFGRSPSRESHISKTSQTSRKSHVSNKSNKTEQSINNLSKSKLVQVRQKQKQIQHFKKRMLQQKLYQDKLKQLRAQTNVLTISRRVKTRSQISQKIVKQNKQQIDLIRNFAVRDNWENLKFKVVRNQNRKQRNLKNITIDTNKDLDLYYVKKVNKQIQNTTQMKNKTKYEEKTRYSNDWQNHYNQLRRQSISFTKQQNSEKARLAEQRKSLGMREQKRLRQQINNYQLQKLREAQMRRQQQKQKRRLFGISQQVKREIVSQNKKVLQTSQSTRAKVQIKHFNDKVRELEQLDTLRKKLRTGQISTNKYKEKRSFSKAVDSSLRQSFTSGNNRNNANFNTIFM